MTRSVPMGQLGGLYAEGRERFISLVLDADPSAPVPTCPAWTVKDVLAHVAGIPADILAGRLDGVATDPWTAAQVEARRDATIADITAEWRETGAQVDGMVDAFGPTGKQLLLDLTTHEQDVRHALGAPALRDAPVLDVGLDFLAFGLGTALTRPLAIEAEGRTWQAGEGEPAAVLRGSRFDVVRACTGRRSRAQVEAMDWSGDHAAFVDALEFGPFTFPPSDITE